MRLGNKRRGTGEEGEERGGSISCNASADEKYGAGNVYPKAREVVTVGEQRIHPLKLGHMEGSGIGKATRARDSRATRSAMNAIANSPYGARKLEYKLGNTRQGSLIRT